jgi:PAS domain S-box-containing protein
MLASELDQLRHQLKQIEAENERLRQSTHQLGVDAALHAARSTEAEGRLQAILSSATDYAIFTTDERGIVTSWNEGAWRLLGWHEDEILDQDGQVIFTPEDRERGAPEREREAASTKGRAEDERWHLRKDGSRFWASGLLMPLRDGSPGYLKILRDYTDRRQHAGALRESEALKTTILEAALDCIVSIRADSTIIEWNPAAERTFGYSKSGAIGQDIAQLIIPPEFRERHYKGMAHYLATGYGPVLGHRVELEALRSDGSRFPVELAITPTSIVGQPQFTAYLRDISERKRAEAALREAQAVAEREAARTGAILRQLAEGVIVTDTSGTITFVNEAATRIHGVEKLGVTPDAYADTYHLFTEDGCPYPPEELPLARAVLKGETVEDARWRIRRPDGHDVIAVGSARPILTPEGEQTGAVLTLRDDTARATAEAALRESEAQLSQESARLRVLIDNLPVGVCFFDLDGKAVLTNPAFRHFLPGEPLPSRLPDGEERWLAWDENGERLPRDLYPGARALRGEVVPGAEFLYRPKDGPEIWTRMGGVPILGSEGEVVAALLVVVDVDAQKRAQEALERLNQGLEQEVAARTAERDQTWLRSHDLLAVAGFDGQLKAINPAWSRVLGVDEATLLSTPFTGLIHPDDLPAVGEVVRAMMRGQTTEHFEDRLRTSGGSYRTISWTAVPEGDVFYAIGRDVTEWRYTEEQLRQAQKMEAVGQLTGGVAHDFNNLLTIIRSSVEFLQRPNLPEERRRRYMEAINETVNRASKLTSQLLAFARRQALKPEVFDVSERIRSVRDMLRTVMGSRIQIVTNITCGTCYVEADVVQFETALVNMAVNARDAMDGEGRLTVQLAEASQIPAIRAHAAKLGRFVAVSLTDTGSGIQADKLEHIFEPFFTTKDVGKGTGLGLSQVFGFAKQSGGDIDVKSEVGRGTTFTLYLPQAERNMVTEGTGAGADRAEVAEHGQGRRVLVVEDNVEVGQFSTQLLQDLGYETVWATNAGEALKLLEEESTGFDVVFSDVVMPGISGVDLGHEIERRYPGLPVVLTSGYSHVLAQEGPHGFELLHKPYAAEEVSRVLRRMMQGQERNGGR